MKTFWRVLCLVIFLAGLVSFSRAQMRKNETLDLEPASPFVLITTHYNVSPEGLKVVVGERIRFVKANGEWRQMRHDSSDSGAASKKESAVFAGTEEGAFQKAPDVAERKEVSPGANQKVQQCFRSPSCLNGQLSFIRNEEIVGLMTYVLRHEIKNPASPIDWIEESYSPKTGPIALRNVKHFRDGSQMVMEARKIEFRDVPDDLNNDIKAMRNMKEESK